MGLKCGLLIILCFSVKIPFQKQLTEGYKVVKLDWQGQILVKVSKSQIVKVAGHVVLQSSSTVIVPIGD